MEKLKPESIKKWFNVFLLSDWIISIVLLIGAVGLMQIDPFHPFLPLGSDNPTVSYPNKDSYVPTWLAGVLGYGIPIVCVICTQIVLVILAKDKWDWVHDFHHGVLGVLESAAFSLFIVNIFKPFAGRYRPHYLAVKDDEDLEVEGRKSFPSGHSACAFSGFGFMAFYLAGKLGLLAKGRGGQMYKSVIVMLPCCAAFAIAITRVRDYHHNYSDIMAGSIIGLMCGAGAYYNLYPSLFSRNCHVPRDGPKGTTIGIIREANAEKMKDDDVEMA